MALTSDGSLRLYDVLTPGDVPVERWRLRVVTPAAAPVSFAFGRGSGWDALSVYVLAEDGKIHVAAPVAPVGTRLAKDAWSRMIDEVRAVIERESVSTPPVEEGSNAVMQSDPFLGGVTVSVGATPRRLLDFSVGEELDAGDNESSESEGVEESWALRQAHMQRRFLEHVFAPAADGDMVAVREFKPAPLLFQGPLYTEHDDLDEDEDGGELPDACKYVELTLLHCGSNRPPVLLRTTRAGEVSVLIGMEKVEAQWFLSADSFAATGDELLEASEEYAECARTVAPLLLCFEHLSFGGHVKLFLLGQKTDADVLYGVTAKSVFSVRLSFISAITDVGTLESTPKSVISQILSIWKPEPAEDGVDDDVVLLGLAPFFASGQGPVALVLSSDGVLHVSDPLRWMTDLENAWPRSWLGSGPGSDLTWKSERPLTGSRAFALPDSGKEVMELLHLIQTLQGTHGGRVTPGTVGKVANVKAYAPVLEYLENRLEVFTGGPDGPGIGDSFKSLADVLHQWSTDLQARAGSQVDSSENLQTDLSDVESSEHNLRRKLLQVEGKNLALGERIRDMMKKIQQGDSELSTAEFERHSRLKEKKRRVLALKKRLPELESAIQARKRTLSQEQVGDRQSTPGRGAQSPYGTPGRGRGIQSPVSASRRSKRWSASPSWRNKDSPLSQRRPEWSPQSEGIDLTRKELEQIKEALEKHSTEIGNAMELSTKLWQRLSIS